jgi:hypothetical protein
VTSEAPYSDAFGTIKADDQGSLNIMLGKLEGGLEREVVMRVVNTTVRNEILPCPRFKGEELVLDVHIDRTGTVSEVAPVRGKEKKVLLECATRALLKAQFPAAFEATKLAVFVHTGEGGWGLVSTGSDPIECKESATVRCGTVKPDPAQDKKVIRTAIRAHLAEVRRCYERELVHKPDLKGTVVVRFMIAPDGSVAKSVAAGMEQSVADCVASVVKTIRFPKVAGGGYVNTRYPFTFQPADKQPKPDLQQ